MKRIAVGVALLAFSLAFLAAPARVYAQDNSDQVRANREKLEEQKQEEINPLLRIYHEKQKENAEIEQRYQRTLRATDQSKAPAHNDPWANMR
jgi:hypothetical protein